jgi:hypothetical protein
MTEIREITTAIVQEIGKRDARIYELEEQVELLKKSLKIIAESEEYNGDSFVCDFQTLQNVAWKALEQTEINK